ncbi:hypothetical protein U9M48_027506, partial [Paspalum notatum var. saurae]
MPPFLRRWADLPPELLCLIGDRLDLKWYASARGACTAWRCALAPPSPALLVVASDAARLCPYASSLTTRRSFQLTAIVSGSRCVGSSNGWLALSSDPTVFVLLNPIAGVEILLPPLIYKRRCWVSKVVFAPSPAKDDFAAAAICDIDRIAYVTAGAKRWAVMDPVRLASGDQLTDVVYADNGKVYFLTQFGDVNVLRLPERHGRKPANADEAGPSSKPEFSVLQPPINSRPLRWEDYDLLPARNQGPTVPASATLMAVPIPDDESQGPHLNAPATVEPPLSEANDLRFNPATVFAPPYDTVSAFTSAKNLVFCEGSLYQVWRNASCAVTLRLPGGGHCRVAENEILVLRHYPRRQPCWDVVKDLGGYSLFVGRNNAVSMYAEGIPGLRGNCVYWIGGRGRDRGMVFDMESGRSTPCQSPQVGNQHHTICWFFLNHGNSSSGSNGGWKVYHTPRARAPADILALDMEYQDLDGI